MATSGSDSDNDNFVSTSGISMVCPVLQGLRQRQDSSVSSASVTSQVLKRKLEVKQRKFTNAEMKYKEDLDIHKQWRIELQLEEERIKQRKAEIGKGKEQLKEQILSDRSKIKHLELEKLGLATAVSENSRKLESVKSEFFMKKTLIQEVFKELGAVAGKMQELSLDISSKILDVDEETKDVPE